jgi:hypothetical protein
MSNLTQDLVHYTKFSLEKFNGSQSRYKVNQSLRTTTNSKLLKFSWAFTRDSYELWNSVKKSEDCDWEGFNWADTHWRSLRKEYKRDVILWVAKACHSKAFVKGEIQPNIRVPRTVSLLSYFPKQNILFQTTKMDDWTIEFEYHNIDHKIYNMIYDWRNPLTVVSGGTAPGGW